jgi:hypothetical protein
VFALMPELSANGKPLRYVACVSYPRSGHHLTVRILTKYFVDRFNYCQFYNSSNETCCGTFPCTNAHVTFTKNHDMGVGIPPYQGIPKMVGIPYLIHIRNFLEAAVSDYNLFLRTHEDSAEAWSAFARRKVNYYRQFVRKWILAGDTIEKLTVKYEQLTAQPLEIFAQILSFFRPDEGLNMARLHELICHAALEDVQPVETRVIENFGVRSRRRIEEFQHFRADEFAELESEIAAELQSLGYPLRFAPSHPKIVPVVDPGSVTVPGMEGLLHGV